MACAGYSHWEREHRFSRRLQNSLQRSNGAVQSLHHGLLLYFVPQQFNPQKALRKQPRSLVPFHRLNVATTGSKSSYSFLIFLLLWKTFNTSMENGKSLVGGL